MALQAAHSSGNRLLFSPRKAAASAPAGLNMYLSDPHEQSFLEWEKRVELFIVATKPKHPIVFTELTCTDRTQRMPPPLDAIGQHFNLANCKNNSARTIGSHRKEKALMAISDFVSLKQEPKESLQPFWNALHGLTTNCEIEQQTHHLAYDKFILTTHNNATQERLCTEPKSSREEAMKFAITFEKKSKRQDS